MTSRTEEKVEEQGREEILLPALARSQIVVTVAGLEPGALAHSRATFNLTEANSNEEWMRTCMYWLKPAREGCTYGIPGQAFHECLCTAVQRMIKGWKMKGPVVRAAVTVIAGPDGLVPVRGQEPTVHETWAVVNKGQVNRIRALIPTGWEADIRFDYLPDQVKTEILLQGLLLGGDGIGVLDWRPEKGGIYGRFKLKDAKVVF